MKLKLSEIKQKFTINWMTLLVAWRGFGNLNKLISIHDIQQFAIENIEKESEYSSNLSNMAILSTFSATEQNKIDSLLGIMADSESSDKDTEIQKLIVCLLEKQIQELPDDPIYGLIQLTEFWSDLNFPKNSPHRVQGKGNKITPQKYYTYKNYRKILKEHKEWIEKMHLKLIKKDK